MRLVIQRVTRASVTIDNKKKSEIGLGLLVLIGFGNNDDEKIVDKYLNKLIKLRVFADEAGKTNKSVKDVNGGLLLVSQFTLMANCKEGNRPSFTNALNPKEANRLYEYMIEKAREQVKEVGVGEFGADMKVELLNDGPFTVVIDENNI